MVEREQWASRVGFILAAVGSAVGLGNIWRFPYVTAENGGAAFLVVYLAAVVAIGLPAMLAEFVVGRGSHRNVVDAFERVGYPRARVIGVVGLFTGFFILAYYSVVGGWVLRYVLASATGAYFGKPSAYFGAISAGLDALAFHAIFMATTVGIVAAGVREGIEVATKLMVPTILVLMVALAAWALTLPGAGDGLAYYLTPDVGVLVSNLGTILPFAVGQAFFTLSLGMGAMITYASYVGDEDNLGVDALTIVLFNTFVGVLAGFVVFPLLFAQGVDPGDPGPGAIFVSIATAFGELDATFGTLPVGRVLGVVFFGVVAIAALSSAISLLEVVVSYVLDNYDVDRPAAATAVGTLMFLVGVPSALDTDVLSLADTVASNLLLPLGVTLVVVFVGWVFGRQAVEELDVGTGEGETLESVWLWHVRVALVVAVVFTLALSVAELLGAEVLP